MDILALSNLLAALVIAAIGASVLLRDRTRRTYTTFATFAFVVALWYLLKFISGMLSSDIFGWLALWTAATVPPTALRFFRHFVAEPALGGKPRPPRVTLVWTMLAYAALLYAGAVMLSGAAPIHKTLWFQIPLGAYVFLGLYRSVYDLYAAYRGTVTRVEKTRIWYLMVGGFVAITLTLTDFLPRFGITWPTLGNVLTILYLYFLSQTLFRYRLLDLNELVGKMVVLGTLVVLLSAVYGVLLSWVGGGQEGLFILNTLVASFVILVLFEPVRTRLENTMNRWLVRQRHELRGRVDSLRRELANVVDVDEMGRRILSALEESRRVTHASVYLLDSEGSGYDLVNHYGPAPTERIETAGSRVFLDRLRDGHISLEVLKRELERHEASADKQHTTAVESLDAIARTLVAMKASLVVPMFGSEETEQGPWLLGMLAVRDDRLDSAFSYDDIDLFSQLAAQAALTIENTQAFERVQDRDRLAAIGEMAAGLAHEIRNPLGAIKGAAQLLVGPDGKPTVTSDSAEFLEIIVEEVNRLNNVVTQFLDYARPGRGGTGEYIELDLNDVIMKTIPLLENDAAAEGIGIEAKLDELLPPVVGDPEQLRQVFLNLGLNALQAMEGKGRLDVITTRRRRSSLGYGVFAEVRFRDNGPGIARDRIQNLFIPFYTTKQKGTGLGLPISQRIITQHGGTIEVRSRSGHGSTFSVFLPAIGPSLAPDAPPPRRPTDSSSMTITRPISGFRATQREADESSASAETPSDEVKSPQ